MALSYTPVTFKIAKKAMQHTGTTDPKEIEEHFKEDEAKEATEALTGQPQFTDTPVPPPNLRSSREHDLPPEPVAAQPKEAPKKPALTKRLPKKQKAAEPATIETTPAPTPKVTPQYPFHTDLPERAHGGAGPIAAPAPKLGLWDRIKSKVNDFTGNLETQSYMHDPIIESERMKFKLGHKSASLDRVKSRLKQLGVPPEQQEMLIRSVIGGK